MHYKSKITRVGNSSAVILPNELLEQLRLKQGDAIYISTRNQEISLSACAPEFAADMALVDEIMHEDHNTLNKLAQ